MVSGFSELLGLGLGDSRVQGKYGSGIIGLAVLGFGALGVRVCWG